MFNYKIITVPGYIYVITGELSEVYIKFMFELNANAYKESNYIEYM